ncbi:MAG: hypothetical protein LEGION0403_FIIPPAGN_02398 [Legionella sp.]|uniref:conjugal transfer protein TrbN n=1 Tax=Legionella sp. TaxID=459 RepID=UPI003D0AACC3
MPIPVDVSIIHQERVACTIMASIKYQVPTNILLAIAEKEGGKPGEWSKNSNGTYDVGSMQLNTVYLNDLARFGIKPSDVAHRGCYSYDLAAWRVRGHLIHDSQDLWTRAANYHSKTPKYNRIYRADLIKKAQKWQRWLDLNFKTYHVTTPGAAPTSIQQRHTLTHQDRVVYAPSHPIISKSKVLMPSNQAAESALASVFSPTLRGESA